MASRGVNRYERDHSHDLQDPNDELNYDPLNDSPRLEAEDDSIEDQQYQHQHHERENMKTDYEEEEEDDIIWLDFEFDLPMHVDLSAEDISEAISYSLHIGTAAIRVDEFIPTEDEKGLIIKGFIQSTQTNHVSMGRLFGSCVQSGNFTRALHRVSRIPIHIPTANNEEEEEEEEAEEAIILVPNNFVVTVASRQTDDMEEIENTKKDINRYGGIMRHREKNSTAVDIGADILDETGCVEDSPLNVLAPLDNRKMDMYSGKEKEKEKYGKDNEYESGTVCVCVVCLLCV